MDEEQIAKEFVTHISNRLQQDFMYAIRKSDNPYEKGQSDIDLVIVPVKGEINSYYFMWMLVEGIIKYGTCKHRNKRTGKISTEALIDVMIFMGKDAEDNCRKAMRKSKKYKIIKRTRIGSA